MSKVKRLLVKYFLLSLSELSVLSMNEAPAKAIILVRIYIKMFWLVYLPWLEVCSSQEVGKDLIKTFNKYLDN